MKCHYEVLSVDRDSDDSQIKTAYRKLALRWHPDKNLSDPDQAKEQFQFVQQAYEVLSDPHERAWYDNHREQILRGGHTNYEDSSLDVFPYFTTSCFKGYGDDPGGFYAVYSEVFNQIATEDLEYMENPEDFEQIPKFGNTASSYEDVHVFFSYWQSYSTKKSYVWLSPLNPNETRERRIMKLIDKENKKVQQKAKKERNDEVRNLVQFVRKRDKRVIAQKKLEEERTAQNKQKQEVMRKEKLKQRQKEIEQQKLQQSEFISLGDIEKQLRQLEQNLVSEFGTDEEYSDDDSDVNESNFDESVSTNSDVAEMNDSLLSDSTTKVSKGTKSGDKSIVDNLYCVACNKIFKNVSSFKNHENSKKHKDKVAVLVDEMNEEESQIDSETEESADENDVIDDEVEIKSESVEDIIEIPISAEEEEEEVVENTNKQSNKNKKAKVQPLPVKNESISEDDDILKEMLHDSADEVWDKKKAKKDKKSKQKPRQKAKEENCEVHVPKTEEPIITKSESSKNRRTNKEIIYNIKTSNNDFDMSHDCATCHQSFESKNKLYTHLKKTGHGVAFQRTVVKTNEKKNKKK